MTALNVKCSIPWTKITPLDIACDLQWQKPDALDVPCDAGWDRTEPLDVSCSEEWVRTDPLDVACDAPWEMTDSLDVECDSPWSSTTKIDVGCDSSWELTEKADASCSMEWTIREILDVLCATSWQRRSNLDVVCSLPFERLDQLDVACDFLWERRTSLDVVCSIDMAPEPELERVIKKCSLNWITFEVPIVIAQEILFYRDSDSEPVNLLNGSIRIDVNSWCWRFQGVIASRADANLIRPTTGPVKVILAINEYYWELLIEEITDNYQYGQGTYVVSGRSPSIELSDPYCEKETGIFSGALNVRQIIDNRINSGGFSWLNDWGDGSNLRDWQIPADTYSYKDKTRMEVVQDICKKIQAFVMTKGGFSGGTPPTFEDRFIFNSRYPYSPHEWDSRTPDEYIGPGHILAHGHKFVPAPGYDYVYVSGKENGILRRVIRTAYGPTKMHPPITNELVTHTDGTFQIGRNALDATEWAQIQHTLALPLPLASSSSKPILLLPGHLINVEDGFEEWRGLVTAVSIVIQAGVGVTMTVDVEQFLTP